MAGVVAAEPIEAEKPVGKMVFGREWVLMMSAIHFDQSTETYAHQTEHGERQTVYHCCDHSIGMHFGLQSIRKRRIEWIDPDVCGDCTV